MPIRSVRSTLGTPPAGSKHRTSPSKVCSRSSLVVNHHHRQRDHDNIAEKHTSPGMPPSSPQPPASLKSNWASSPGVSILVETTARPLNLGPRRARRSRTTDGYEPVYLSVRKISNTLVANNNGAARNNSSILTDQRASIAAGVVAARAGGGLPAFSHFEIVAG